VFVRPVTADQQRPHRPLLPQIHAQRLAGHLPNSKPTPSAQALDHTASSVDHPAGTGQADGNAPCQVQTVIEPPVSSSSSLSSPGEKLAADEPDELTTLHDDELSMQQKNDELRSVCYFFCAAFGFSRVDSVTYLLIFRAHKTKGHDKLS